jgi:hypothetical protein
MRLRTVLAISAAVGACSRENRVPFSATIHDSLVATGARRGGIVSAQQIAPGTWVEMFVVSPYTSAATIRRCFSRDQRIDDHDIFERDDILLMVFRFPDGSLQSRAVRRGTPDFGQDAWGGRYAANATFRVAPGDASSGPQLVPITGLLGRCV